MFCNECGKDMGNTKEKICRDCKKKALEEKTMLMSKEKIEEALEEIKIDEEIDNSKILESEALLDEERKEEFLETKKRTEKSKEKIEKFKKNIEEKADKGIKKIDIFKIFDDEEGEESSEIENNLRVEETQKINSRDLPKRERVVNSRPKQKKVKAKKRKKKKGLVKIIVGAIVVCVIGVAGYSLVSNYITNKVNNEQNIDKQNKIEQNKDYNKNNVIDKNNNKEENIQNDSKPKVDKETNDIPNKGNEQKPDENTQNTDKENAGGNTTDGNIVKPDSGNTQEGNGNNNNSNNNNNITTPDSNDQTGGVDKEPPAPEVTKPEVTNPDTTTPTTPGDKPSTAPQNGATNNTKTIKKNDESNSKMIAVNSSKQ